MALTPEQRRKADRLFDELEAKENKGIFTNDRRTTSETEGFFGGIIGWGMLLFWGWVILKLIGIL